MTYKKKMPKTQVRILIIGASVASSIFLFFLIFHLPARHYLRTLEHELDMLRAKVNQVELIEKKFVSRGEGIRLLKKDIETYGRKFPLSEEDSIKIVSEHARKLGLDVRSVQPAQKTELLGDDGAPVVVDGKACQKLLVTMELFSSYKDLVGYISDLEHFLPPFITIETIRIAKDLTSGRLLVVLGFHMYLLI